MRHVVKTPLIPDPRCLIPASARKTPVCVPACLPCKRHRQAAVIEDKDFYCGLFIILVIKAPKDVDSSISKPE